MTLSRRTVLLGAALLGGGAALGSTYWPTSSVLSEDGTLSAPDVRDALARGDVLLIDIRRPDEWKLTGIAQNAIPLDMRRPDFIDALVDIRRATPDLPVVLTCARGVRSRRMTTRLRDAGIDQVIDMPEGMLGSRAGPGWIARGLPLTPWTG